MMDALQSEFAQAQQVVEDEEEKMRVVLEAVRSQCSSTSEFDDLVKMNQALEAGGSLEAELIAGGKTNFSFKVFVKDPINNHTQNGEENNGNEAQADNSIAIYTKLYLTYAIWDAEQLYEFDIQRAVNEFETVRKLDSGNNNKSSDDAAETFPVMTPYCVLDVESDAKLFLGQWATNTEEQWANQFIDGEVDTRIVHSVAKAFAELNLKEVDQDWNDSARKALLSIGSTVKLHFTQLTLVPEEDCDALMNLLRDVGQDTFDRVVDKYCLQISNDRESLCHSDSHPFNILVESKCNSDEGGKTFGPEGKVIICDWETAICGPTGRDPGVFMSFPTACALCLAVQGHKIAALHLVDCATSFWDTYAQTMVEKGKKDEAALCGIYKVAMGAMGSYLLFNFYILGVLMDTLPLEGVPGVEAEKARASIGVVGMKLLLVSFDETIKKRDNSKNDNPPLPDTISVEGLKKYYRDLMNNQVDELVLANQRTKPRRASFLRTLHRRVSDASSIEEASKRLSKHGLDLSYHKRVSAYDSSDLGASMCSFIDDDSDHFPVTEEMKMQWADD
ncbi:hypothetical protein ACA910_010170 [Epithemia clementina (nom. ined.)]